MKLTEYIQTVQDMGKLSLTPVEIKADDLVIVTCRKAGITPKDCAHIFVQEKVHNPDDVPAMRDLLTCIRGKKTEPAEGKTENAG